MFNRGRYGSVGYNSVFRSIIIPIVGEVKDKMPTGSKNRPGRHARHVRHSINIDGIRKVYRVRIIHLRGKARHYINQEEHVVGTKVIPMNEKRVLSASTRFNGRRQHLLHANIGVRSSALAWMKGTARKTVQFSRLVTAKSKYGNNKHTLSAKGNARHKFNEKKIVTGTRNLRPILVACGLLEEE